MTPLQFTQLANAWIDAVASLLWKLIPLLFAAYVLVKQKVLEAQVQIQFAAQQKHIDANREVAVQALAAAPPPVNRIVVPVTAAAPTPAPAHAPVAAAAASVTTQTTTTVVPEEGK